MAAAFDDLRSSQPPWGQRSVSAPPPPPIASRTAKASVGPKSKGANLQVLDAKSGKKWWEFGLSPAAMPAFVRVCEDSVAEGCSSANAGRGLRAGAARRAIRQSVRIRTDSRLARRSVAALRHPNRRRYRLQTRGFCEREASRSHILSHVRALRRAAEVMEEALYL
jgi:hypothetical protein